MKHDEMNYDEKLDAIIAQALQGDERPSADFSRKVMEAVSQTRQERPASRRKIWTSLAACAAVLLVALPIVRLSTLRMGAAKSANECVSPECISGGELNDTAGADEYDAENYDAEDGGERQQFTLTSGDAKKSPDTENTSPPPQGQDAGDSKLQSVPPVVLRDKDRCAAVRSWLEENGIEPTAEDPAAYVLTADQAAAMQAALPQWDLPTGACTIYLEGS